MYGILSLLQIIFYKYRQLHLKGLCAYRINCNGMGELSAFTWKLRHTGDENQTVCV
jgi:hypothetical protein